MGEQAKDESLGRNIGITIIATGFDNVKKVPEKINKRIGIIGEENKTEDNPNTSVVSDNSGITEISENN